MAVLLAVIGLVIPSIALVGLLLFAMLILMVFEVGQKASQEKIPVSPATHDTDAECPLNEQHDEDR